MSDFDDLSDVIEDLKLFKKFKLKPQAVQINLSSSFPVRAICLACGKAPSTYHWGFQPLLVFSPRTSHIMFDWYKKFIRSFTSSWYKKHQPKYFNSIKEFSVKWAEKSFKPTLHQHKGLNNNANIVEFLACPCGKSVWAFAQKAVQNRLEIKNRKARYNYPTKFVEW